MFKTRFCGQGPSPESVSSPRGAFVGWTSPNNDPSPPSWNMKPINQWRFVSFYIVKPPCTNEKPSCWRLSGDGSAPMPHVGTGLPVFAKFQSQSTVSHVWLPTGTSTIRASKMATRLLLECARKTKWIWRAETRSIRTSKMLLKKTLFLKNNTLPSTVLSTCVLTGIMLTFNRQEVFCNRALTCGSSTINKIHKCNRSFVQCCCKMSEFKS